MRNAMFTIFLQLNDRLLLTITDVQKNNFNRGFKLELIITYYLRFVEKVLWKYCKRNTSYLLFSC